MQVFITGGTGLIGSAVVAELLSAGHTVLALTRSDISAAAAQRAGAASIRGGLSDLDAIRKGAERSDGAIHLAFNHDFSSLEALADRGVRTSAIRMPRTVHNNGTGGFAGRSSPRPCCVHGLTLVAAETRLIREP